MAGSLKVRDNNDELEVNHAINVTPIIDVMLVLLLAFGNDPVARAGLKAALDGKTRGNSDERVFVCADKTVDYGDLMEVMNLLRTAGYLKIGLVGLETLPPPGGAVDAARRIEAP